LRQISETVIKLAVLNHEFYYHFTVALVIHISKHNSAGNQATAITTLNNNTRLYQ